MSRSRNRKRNTHNLKLASLALWLIPTLFLGIIGLSYVYVKTQLHATGTELKSLERELAELNTRNEVLKAQIASLSSRAALQRRLEEGFIKLVPISRERTVRVGATPARIAAVEVRPARGVGK